MDSLFHSEAETVAAYAERRLDPHDQDLFEEHLATCARCRDEVVAVRLILDSRRKSALRRPFFLAAAASVVLLVSLPFARDVWKVRTDPLPALRQGFPVRGGLVETLFPEVGEAIPGGDPPRFVWKDTGEGSTFRVTLLDEEGNLLWSTRTSDTTAAVPEELRLESGGTYYWYVDALSSEGRSTTSGPRRFIVR